MCREEKADPQTRFLEKKYYPTIGRLEILFSKLA
jgi:hypothetical protein